MKKFSYKMYGQEVEISVDADSISYRTQLDGEKIDKNNMAGIGVGYVASSVGRPTMIWDENNFLSLVGFYLKTKNQSPNLSNVETEDIKEFIPEYDFKYVHLIIVMRKGAKTKRDSYYFPLDLNNPECLEMLETIKNFYQNIYIGVGNKYEVERALGMDTLRKDVKSGMIKGGGLMLFFILALLLAALAGG